MAKSQLQTTQELIKNIQAGKFLPLYVLHGDEDFFIDEVVEALENHVLTPAEKEFNSTIVYGGEADGMVLVAAAKRFPMMSNYQLIIIKEAQNMKNISAFEKYIEKPITSTVLCFAFKGKKVDTRSKFGKALSALAVLETKKLYEYQMPAVVEEIASSMGLKLTPDAAVYITDCLGASPRSIKNELEKLLIGRTDMNISLAEAKKYIFNTREYGGFDLQAAIGKKDKEKALHIARRMGESSKNAAGDLIPVCSLLSQFFSKVLLLHSAKGDAKAAGINPFFAKDYETARRNYPVAKILQNFQILEEFDFKAKGIAGKSAADEELLTEMTYRLLNTR